MIRSSIILVLTHGILSVSCATSDSTPPAALQGPVDIRWRLKAGDEYSVRFEVHHRGGGGLEAEVEIEGLLKIDRVDPFGAGSGTFTHTKFATRHAGPETAQVLFENGTLKVFSGDALIKDREEVEKRLSTPLDVVMEPEGVLRPEEKHSPFNLFMYGPLGIYLPDRKVEAGARWRSMIRAAHCDTLETEYGFTVEGERCRITGKSTPKAEEEHKILVRHEGTFLSREGYVSDAKLVIDLSPLEMEIKITARTSISRKDR